MTGHADRVLSTTLTLADVAVVADVQRPVVSVWRRRASVDGVELPFPDPVAVRGQVEHFDADAVVAWLERTGRGNNPDARLDAATVALPVDVAEDEIVPLLALAVLARRPLGGLDPSILVELADEADPDDEVLLSEVQALGASARALAAVVDGLLAASLGPADALDRLERGRLRREARVSGLTGDGLDAVVRLCTGLADHLSPEPVPLVDATAGRDRLALDVAHRWPDGRLDALEIADGDAARAARRICLLRGIASRVPSHRAEGPAVRLLSVLGLDAAEAIEQVDDVQLELGDGEVLVVVGGSAVLCDRLSTRSSNVRRADVLRSRTLRLAARLPRGLRRDAPRQEMALWVMARGSRDDVAVADVSTDRLTSAAVDELMMDAVGAVADTRRHAFTHALLQPAPRLLARDVVVPRGARARRLTGPSSADRLLALERLVQEVARPVPPPVLALTPGSPRPSSSTTLADLVAAKQVALLPGARVDPARAEPGGTVRVADPVRGVLGAGFDPLDLTALSARAATTDPGDVVVTHTPRPAACVDTDGGHVVVFPARVLRLRSTASVGPHLLASTVNRLPDGARDWRAWPVPDVPHDQRDALDAHLAALNAHRDALLRRAATTLDLTHHLTDAVAAGAAVLTTEDDD